MYWGVAKLDPLKIQKSPKYQRVETPQCPMYRGVAKLDPWKIQNSPKHRGVETPRCPIHQGVFFGFLNIQVHATAFKAAFIQKLFYISVNYTNRVQTYLKNFPS